jgi:hypothetical protein
MLVVRLGLVVVVVVVVVESQWKVLSQWLLWLPQ